jgi:hypothetical protein
MDLVQKVTSELNGKAGFHTQCMEHDFAAVVQSISRRIWEEENLAHRHFDNRQTPDNMRVLQFARTVAKEAFEAHPNFVRWADN